MARLRLASALRALGTLSLTASLGRVVSEAELPVAIARLLADAEARSAAHWPPRRAPDFGRETFAAGVRAALNRLMEALNLMEYLLLKSSPSIPQEVSAANP